MPVLSKDGKPYPGFNFLVTLGGDQGDGNEGTLVGAFSDVSGLSRKVSYVSYRNGNERFDTARNVPLMHGHTEVVLKRGVIGSDDLFKWLKGVAEGTPAPRQVIITMLDQARKPVSTWKLRNAQPSQWNGPTLNAKSATEVAYEELHLVHEGIEYS